MQVARRAFIWLTFSDLGSFSETCGLAEDWNTRMKFKSKYESSEVCFSHNLQTRTEKRNTYTHKLSLVCSECHKICCLLYFNLSLPLPFILLLPLLPPSHPSAFPCRIDARPPVEPPALPGMTNCYLAPATLLSFILLRYAGRLTAQHDSRRWQ